MGRSTTTRLPWCRFDEHLPRNGGAEDVAICLRATVHCESSRHTPLSLPTEAVHRPCGGKVGVPETTARREMTTGCDPWRGLSLWRLRCGDSAPFVAAARHAPARGVRWGYAGSQLAHQFPQLARRRPMSTVEMAPLAVHTTGLAAAVLGCRAWRAGLVVTALLVTNESFTRGRAASSTVGGGMRMLPHQRITLDEPALLHAFGTSAFAVGRPGATPWRPVLLARAWRCSPARCGASWGRRCG